MFCMLGAVVQLVEYRTRNQEVAGSTHTRSTASNLELVANLLRPALKGYFSADCSSANILNIVRLWNKINKIHVDSSF